MVTDTAPRGRPLPILSSPTSQSAALNAYGHPIQYQQQPRQVNTQQVYQQTNPSSNTSYGNNIMAGPSNYSHPSQRWQQSSSVQISPMSMSSPRDQFSTQSLISKMNSNLSVESDCEDRGDRYGAMDLGQTEEERDRPPVHYSPDEDPSKSPALALLMSIDSYVDGKDRYRLNAMNSQGHHSQAQQQQISNHHQQQGAYGGQGLLVNEATTSTNPATMSGNVPQSPQEYGMPNRVSVQNYFNYGSVGTMPPLPEQHQIDMSHWQMQPEGDPRSKNGECHNQQQVDTSNGQMQPVEVPSQPNNGEFHNQVGGPSPMGDYGQNCTAPQGVMQPLPNGPYPNHGMGNNSNNTSPPRRTFAT